MSEEPEAVKQEDRQTWRTATASGSGSRDRSASSFGSRANLSREDRGATSSRVRAKRPADEYSKDQWDQTPFRATPDRISQQKFLQDAGYECGPVEALMAYYQRVARGRPRAQLTIDEVTTDFLADLNWGTTDPEEVQWYLRSHHGLRDEINVKGRWVYKSNTQKLGKLWGPKLYATQPPANLYPLEEWQRRPRNPVFGEKYAKHYYGRDGEADTLESIAEKYTRDHPDRPITADEIADINWGTRDPMEVRYYNLKHNQSAHETSGTGPFELRDTDGRPWLWMPAGLERLAHPYRSPGREIGHVAPYTSDYPHTNTLVARATYAVELKLGDTDALFDCNDQGGPTDLGRKQRLQALGYFYHPLQHTEANAASKIVWDYYWDVVHGENYEAGDPTLLPSLKDACLKYELNNNLVCVPRGNMPKKGEIMDGRLPRKGEVGMIRVPGGYAYNWPIPKYVDGSLPSDADGKYRRELGDDVYSLEETIYEENEPMGKIPIVARVYKVRADGKPVPVEGVHVYFQLVKPDPVPADHPANAGPPLRNKEANYDIAWNEQPDQVETEDRGPAQFVKKVFADHPPEDADDPRADNAPGKFGGKRDLPVANNIFEVEKTRDGFHTPKTDHADYGKLTPARMVSSGADGKQHKFAVRAVTNDQGYAGVIFMPSRQAGDKYKIRAYVGPPTLGYDGETEPGPVAETGTMVVWRNIRVSRYAQWNPRVTWRTLSDEVQDTLSYSKSSIGAIAETRGERAAQAVGRHVLNIPKKIWQSAGMDGRMADFDFGGTAPHVDDGEVRGPTPLSARKHRPVKLAFGWGPIEFNVYRPQEVKFPALISQFRRYFVELILDMDPRPEAISAEEMREATRAGRKAAADARLVAKEVDWETLIFDDPLSPFLINGRYYKHYNKLIKKKAGGPQVDALTLEDWKVIVDLLGDEGPVLLAMIQHFAGGGVLPGMTLIQVPMCGTYTLLEPMSNMNAGLGLACRTALLFGKEEIFRHTYPATTCATHELGHVLGRCHQQPTPPTGDDWQHELQVPAEERKQEEESDFGRAKWDERKDEPTDICVMSYRGCYGDFCGRCALAFRGWRTKYEQGHGDDRA